MGSHHTTVTYLTTSVTSLLPSSIISTSLLPSSTMPPFRAVVEPANGGKCLGNTALLPLRQTTKGSDIGPAPSTQGEDIVDQALNLFKANILFKQFEMETEVDRVLVYITLYTIECLKRLQKCSSKEQGTREMYTAALESFHLPGEAGFPLNAFYTKPRTVEAGDGGQVGGEGVRPCLGYRWGT